LQTRTWKLNKDTKNIRTISLVQEHKDVSKLFKLYLVLKHTTNAIAMVSCWELAYQHASTWKQTVEASAQQD